MVEAALAGFLGSAPNSLVVATSTRSASPGRVEVGEERVERPVEVPHQLVVAVEVAFVGVEVAVEGDVDDAYADPGGEHRRR